MGQGNWDALFGVAGLVADSYLFAEMSAWLARTLGRVGNRGELSLVKLVPAPTAVVVLGMAALLTAVLVLIEWVTVR